MSENNLTLVAAAATVVGPAGDRDPADWQAAMLDTAVALYAMASANGVVGKYLDGIARVEDAAANKRTKEGKIFTATVRSSDKEQATGRALIVLTNFDEATKKWKDENVRTDFLSNEDGLGKRLAKMARSLEGHKVKVWVELEPMNNGSGQSVRMLRHIEDLGANTAFAEAEAA